MELWWQTISTFERGLFLIGAPFTLILIIQTILLIFGHGGDSDLDSDTSGLDLDTGELDLDASADTDFDTLDGVDPGLRIFSIRGIVGFFAVGCWAGIAALESGLSNTVSLLISVAAGIATMVAIAKLLSAFNKLQENGTMDLRTALGKTATVYIPIPAARSGAGKVTLTISDTFTEMEAITDGNTLKTGSTVRVTDIQGNTLVVEEW